MSDDTVKLHDGELDIDAALVSRLVAAQFPRWAGRGVRPLPDPGTDNLMFRLGDDLVARLPRMPGAVGTIRKEHRWLPWLAPQLPLAVPEPVGLGSPAEGYPLPWSVSRWLPGDHRLTDLAAAAVALGDFVAALQKVDTADAPPAHRRSLLDWDKAVTRALADFDVPGAAAIWSAALRLPAWDRPPLWVHSDLLPPNLLGQDGHLTAVIDFGCAGVADPACDLMAAWTVLDAETRPLFRARVRPDDATWERGRAWALAFGLASWHYYEQSNPSFAAVGRRSVLEAVSPAGTRRS